MMKRAVSDDWSTAYGNKGATAAAGYQRRRTKASTGDLPPFAVMVLYSLIFAGFIGFIVYSHTPAPAKQTQQEAVELSYENQ